MIVVRWESPGPDQLADLGPLDDPFFGIFGIGVCSVIFG